MVRLWLHSDSFQAFDSDMDSSLWQLLCDPTVILCSVCLKARQKRGNNGMLERKMGIKMVARKKRAKRKCLDKST
jgi:hypothetical protein